MQTEEGIEYAMQVAFAVGRIEAAEDLVTTLRNYRKNTAASICEAYMNDQIEKLRNL